MGIRQICFTFDDFSDISDLNLNGTTTTTNTGGQTVLRLTSANFNEAGSAFTIDTFPVSNGFSTFFSFQMTNPGGNLPDTDPITGGDGLVFILQNSLAGSDAIGSLGFGIGYQGISNSVGVELDTFNNGAIDDNSGNHVGINLNGSVDSVVTTPITPLFNNGEVWFVWIDYSATTNLLEVRVSTTNVRPLNPTITHTVNVFDALGGSQQAYVGFSAGTGASFENHDILSWEFCIPL